MQRLALRSDVFVPKSVAGVVVGYLLEHDTLSLTPTLPEDARKILLLFSGTSTNMLMPPRCKLSFSFGGKV